MNYRELADLIQSQMQQQQGYGAYVLPDGQLHGPSGFIMPVHFAAHPGSRAGHTVV